MTLRYKPETVEELKHIIAERCGSGEYVVLEQDAYTGRLRMEKPLWKGRISWL